MKTGRAGPVFIAFKKSGAFEDRSNPLTATNTHGDQAIFATNTLKFVQRLGCDESTGTANRMTKGDSAAIDVATVAVESQFAFATDKLCGKRLVDFDQSDISHRPPSRLSRATRVNTIRQ